MHNYSSAEPHLNPEELTLQQQAIYDDVCRAFPAALLEYLHQLAFKDIEHLMRTIAYWVTITHPDATDA